MEFRFGTRCGRTGNHEGTNDFLDMVVPAFPMNLTQALYIVSSNFNLLILPY